MTTTYRCPECQARLEAEEGAVGREIECPECHTPVTLGTREARPEPAGSERGKKAFRVTAKDIDPEKEVFRTRPTLLFSGPAILGVLLAAAGAASLLFFAASATAPLGIAALVVLGIGIILFLVALVGVWSCRIVVTSERTQLVRGILSRHSTEVRHEDVATLKVEQNLLQRLLGHGHVMLSSAGESDMEIVARSVKHPDRVAALVRQYQ